VIELDDGSVVVADAGSHSILWFGTDGVRTAAAGGAGDGPGEFRSIAWIGKARADSIYAWDSRLKRLSVLHAGRFERSFELEPYQTWPGLTPIGSLTNGNLIAFGGYGVPGVGTPLGVHREEVPVWILSPAGGVRLEIDRVASYAMEYRAGATPGTVMRGLLPFGATTLIATGNDRIVVGDNASYHLRMFDGSGDLVQVVRLHETPERVQAEDLALELDRRLASLPPIEEIREGTRANFSATPVPDFKPFYGLLRVDADENTWVSRRSATPSSGASWDIFAPGGDWLGSLLTPLGVHVTYIGADQVFGVRTDELGRGGGCVRTVPLSRLPRSW
jgi:hypothetical protein